MGGKTGRGSCGWINGKSRPITRLMGKKMTAVWMLTSSSDQVTANGPTEKEKHDINPHPRPLKSSPRYSSPRFKCCFKIYFNWSVTALQCCASFCCAALSISCENTLIYPLPNCPPPTPTPILPPQVSTEPRAELPVLYSGFPLATQFTCGTAHVSYSLSSSRPLLPMPGPKSMLYVLQFKYLFTN